MQGLNKLASNRLLILALPLISVAGCAWIERAPEQHGSGVSQASEPAVPAIKRLPSLASVDPAAGNVRPVSWEQGSDQFPLAVANIAPAPPVEILDGEDASYPIDLANALALAGADNLYIELARERVLEAESRYLAARALWLPSVRFGVAYNKHDGRLQATQGDVVEAGRNSLFVGGGAGLGNVPLAAGSSGPSRLMANLSLADAAFEPLAAQQSLIMHEAAQQAALSDTMLDVAVAYFELVKQRDKLHNAQSTLASATETLGHVQQFEKEGFSSSAEVHRARTEQAAWQREVENARRTASRQSVRLALLLRLDPNTILLPSTDTVVPIEFVAADSGKSDLIQQALTSRAEMAQYEALVDESCWRVNQENWRPWLPNVQVGAGVGSFGGGPSSDFPSAAGRSDVDLLAVWELRNFGVGTVAARRERESQWRQATHQLTLMQDQITAEVVAAVDDVASFQREIEITQAAIGAAEESYRLNQQRIREGVGTPIEVIQSIRALAAARDALAEAITSYHQAQYRLLHAVGGPIVNAEAVPQGTS